MTDVIDPETGEKWKYNEFTVTRVFTSDYRDNDLDYPDPFPVENIKRVDRPTTLIKDNEVSRVDERDGGFRRACILADYIRRLRYPARAHHTMNYQVVVPPIVVVVRAGEMCRIGD